MGHRGRALRRRYGRSAIHAGGFGRKGSLWQVSLQVTSPSRPNLRHQLEYTVRAPNPVEAEARAAKDARSDGNTVVAVVGIQRRPG